MTAERFARVSELVLALRGLPRDACDRRLDEACGSDTALKAEVESMLAADRNLTSGGLRTGSGGRLVATFLEEDGRNAAELPERIGRYEVVRVVGQGGMGIVYEARQEEPQRMVALKVIRPGCATPNLLRRLSHEAEILAQLRHPGIAHVYEAGTAQVRGPGGVSAQPFFAMELIDGLPLTRFVQERRVKSRDRLELLARVCDAVQHAHQKGIIHRDLKPGNVLVVEEPQAESTRGSAGIGAANLRIAQRSQRTSAGAPRSLTAQPKVLDFGVARFAGQDRTEETLRTQPGQLIGTLAYMSPEQVAGDPDSIDTRSDVYALGVMLYELLAERLPFDLASAPLPDAARRIREETPPALSSISRGLRGDVETIVARAMHKERARRYESAAALAADIRRHLRGEPIDARRDSAFYVLRKSAWRYRWAISAAGALVAALGAFAVFAGYQSEAHRQSAILERRLREEAQNAEARAVVARSEAETQRLQALAAEAEAERRRREAVAAQLAETGARQQAERSAGRARTVSTFLVEMLGLADPDISATPNVTVREVLDRAAVRVGDQFEAQPEDEATIRAVLGNAYLALGEPESAQAQLERALELRRQINPSDDHSIYECLWPLAQALGDRGDTLARFRNGECMSLGRRMLERSCREVAAALTEITRRERRSVGAAELAAELARFSGAAESHFTGTDVRWRLLGDQLALIAHRYAEDLNPEAACCFLREALAAYRRVLPETHTRIVRALGTLMSSELRCGQYAEAEAVANESIALLARTLTPDHWYVAVFHARRAACLLAQQRFEEAEPLLLEGYAKVTAARGPAGPYAAEVLGNLVRLYDATARPDEAAERRAALAAALCGAEQKLGWLSSQNEQGMVQLLFDASLAELSAAFDDLERELASQPAGLPARIARTLELRRSLLPDDDPISAVCAELYWHWLNRLRSGKRGPLDEGCEALSAETVRIARVNAAIHPRKAADYLVWRAWWFWEVHAFADAEACSREALAILRNGYGTYAYTDYVEYQLSALLFEQQRYEEAEPLAISGYRGLLAYGGPKNGNTRTALKNLQRLYEEWGRFDEFSRYATIELRRTLAEAPTHWRNLRNETWPVLQNPGQPREAYELALTAAECLVAHAPRDVGIVRRLAVAHYRLGHWPTALELLKRVERMKDREGRVQEPLDWAFVAMTYAQLGDRWAAHAALATARELLQESAAPPDANEARALREAEVLLAAFGVDH